MGIIMSNFFILATITRKEKIQKIGISEKKARGYDRTRLCEL